VWIKTAENCSWLPAPKVDIYQVIFSFYHTHIHTFPYLHCDDLQKKHTAMNKRITKYQNEILDNGAGAK